MNIIVLYGGNSPEKEVSASSAFEIAKALHSIGHKVVSLNLTGIYFVENKIYNFEQLCETIDLLENNITFDQSKEISDSVIEFCKLADIVFLATHGGIGEDGRLQAILELENISFTGNKYFSVALSMDKRLSKVIMKSKNLYVPKEYKYLKIKSKDFPIVAKPNNNGSSIGVQIIENVNNLPEYDSNTIYEELVLGREFSVGIVGAKVFSPVEVIVKEGFYDYQKKYTPGAVEEICPANISKPLSKKLKQLAQIVHNTLGLEVYSRTDFIVTPDDKIYFIEVNSVPGMTPTSLLPKEAKAMGMSYSELCEEIIKNSIILNDLNAKI